MRVNKKFHDVKRKKYEIHNDSHLFPIQIGAKLNHLSNNTNNQEGLKTAQKIMEKFGWRKGNGLGKNEQGITAALIVQKIDSRTAIITTATSYADDLRRPKLSNGHRSIRTSLTPSPVLSLTNMVGSGEVDTNLEEETIEECSKYGCVENVIIYEVTELDFSKDDTVRIFVKFNSFYYTVKIVADLNG